MTDKPKRRWYQYSLRSLFVVMTLFACVCSWYGHEMREAAKRRATVAEVVERGGFFIYGSDLARLQPSWFSFLRLLHGDEKLGKPMAVDFAARSNTDGLAYLKDLPTIELISLESSQVTDDGLVHLQDVAKLRGLNLIDTRITDAGLVHLEGLTNLEDLLLRGPKISDAGMEHLKGLTNLRELQLDETNISDAGLAHLKDLKIIECLDLEGTRITDAGMVHLKGFTKLDTLFMEYTNVTVEGVDNLRKALPSCDIHCDQDPCEGLKDLHGGIDRLHW